jgi:hypothetical protein
MVLKLLLKTRPQRALAQAYDLVSQTLLTIVVAVKDERKAK